MNMPPNTELRGLEKLKRKREDAARSAVERSRRYRERRRNGMLCLMIELRGEEIEALVRMKLLKAPTRDDDAIREAVYQHLENTLDAS